MVQLRKRRNETGSVDLSDGMGWDAVLHGELAYKKRRLLEPCWPWAGSSSVPSNAVWSAANHEQLSQKQVERKQAPRTSSVSRPSRRASRYKDILRLSVRRRKETSIGRLGQWQWQRYPEMPLSSFEHGVHGTVGRFLWVIKPAVHRVLCVYSRC